MGGRGPVTACTCVAFATPTVCCITMTVPVPHSVFSPVLSCHCGNTGCGCARMAAVWRHVCCSCNKRLSPGPTSFRASFGRQSKRRSHKQNTPQHTVMAVAPVLVLLLALLASGAAQAINATACGQLALSFAACVNNQPSSSNAPAGSFCCGQATALVSSCGGLANLFANRLYVGDYGTEQVIVNQLTACPGIPVGAVITRTRIFRMRAPVPLPHPPPRTPSRLRD